MTWAHSAVTCRVVGYCTVFGGAAKHAVWTENVMQVAHMPQRNDSTEIWLHLATQPVYIL